MILNWIVCLIHIRFDGLKQFLVKSGINEQALRACWVVQGWTQNYSIGNDRYASSLSVQACKEIN